MIFKKTILKTIHSVLSALQTSTVTAMSVAKRGGTWLKSTFIAACKGSNGTLEHSSNILTPRKQDFKGAAEKAHITD